MSHWYLITTKPKQEFRAKENLENQGVKCFMPTIELEKIIRGKRQKVVEALFPNYMFIELDDDHSAWSKVRSTRGVRDFVKFGLTLAKVPLSIIQHMTNNTSNLQTDKFKTNAPMEGDLVTVLSGSFKDFEGIYKKNNGEERSIILINILNKVIELELDNKDVIKH